MARKAVSVTLDETNLTWLRSRARVTSGGNLSEALDRIVSDARAGGRAGPVRSVVGTVRIPPDDPDLSKAKAAVRALFEESLSRPLLAREVGEPHGGAPARPRRDKRNRRG